MCVLFNDNDRLFLGGIAPCVGDGVVYRGFFEWSCDNKDMASACMQAFDGRHDFQQPDVGRRVSKGCVNEVSAVVVRSRYDDSFTVFRIDSMYAI